MIIDFYLGNSQDARGRLIEDVWRMNYADLEATHDYIQWLFPTWNRSQFEPDAPVLDEETRELFLSDSELRRRLVKSLDLMLDFFGLEREGEEVCRSSAFLDRMGHWLTPGNHNHLRLTRIMLSLWTLGCQAEARALHQCLDRIEADFPDRITKRTKEFWDDAARKD